MSDRMLPKMQRNISLANPIPNGMTGGYHSLNNGIFLLFKN